jgi:hypothetical protein
MAISGAWSVALSRGWPLQGGIDVGISTKLPGGEIYGIVERTYLLKHGIAGWPQIAIGNKFVSYIRFVQAQSEEATSCQVVYDHLTGRGLSCYCLLYILHSKHIHGSKRREYQ